MSDNELVECPYCGATQGSWAFFCSECDEPLALAAGRQKRGGLLDDPIGYVLEAWLPALLPRQPIEIARAIPFLIVCLALCAPWYTPDVLSVGVGWFLAAERAGSTCGLCGVPYLALLLSGIVAIATRVKEEKPRLHNIAVWTYRGVLLLWLAEMTTFFFTEGIVGWNVDYSGYWGPKLFTIGIGLAIVVELMAIFAGLLRKLRTPPEAQ